MLILCGNILNLCLFGQMKRMYPSGRDVNLSSMKNPFAKLVLAFHNDYEDFNFSYHSSFFSCQITAQLTRFQIQEHIKFCLLFHQ